MASDRRRNCQRCGGHDSLVGPISWRGKCQSCGLEAQTEAIVQMSYHSGPVFQRWRIGMVGCVGGSLVSDSRND